MSLFVYNGEERQNFSLPVNWSLLSYGLPLGQETSYASIHRLTEEALTHPLDAPLLEKSLSRGKRVAIVTDDGARPTPTWEILPVLLKKLSEQGVKREDIRVVVGLGTHAVMGDEALGRKIGEEIMQDYRVIQHDCRSEDLVPIGRLETGAEVRINRDVAEADIRFGLGSIFPHPMNGYGGGPKIVFPGISNYDAIREHHLAWTVHPRSIFGNVAGNRFYRKSFGWPPWQISPILLTASSIARIEWPLFCSALSKVFTGGVQRFRRSSVE